MPGEGGLTGPSAQAIEAARDRALEVRPARADLQQPVALLADPRAGRVEPFERGRRERAVVQPRVSSSIPITTTTW